MSTFTGLICPKCRGQMTTYERSGITIDQCTECRGIFLDRGELERLIDAETTHTTGRPAPPWQPRHHEYDHHDDHHYRGRDKHQQRRGFLGDLFD